MECLNFLNPDGSDSYIFLQQAQDQCVPTHKNIFNEIQCIMSTHSDSTREESIQATVTKGNAVQTLYKCEN